MTLQPLGARILVHRLPPPEQTRGGIYLLGREYPTIGRVKAIGAGRKLKGSAAFPGSIYLDDSKVQRIHLPEALWGAIALYDFIMFHRDAIRQENVLADDHVMLSREHCLASYIGESMKSFRPLGDRVLVRPLDEVKQVGSIHLPDQSVERPVYGRVIAVGMGRFAENGAYIPCDVSVGDKVIYGKFMGSEVKLDGVEHLLIREDDIMGVERE